MDSPLCFKQIITTKLKSFQHEFILSSIIVNMQRPILLSFGVPIASEIHQLSVRKGDQLWEGENKSLLVYKLCKFIQWSWCPPIRSDKDVIQYIILVPPNWASDMSSSGGKTGWGSDGRKDDFDDSHAVHLHFLWSNSSNVTPILKYNSP